MSFSIQGKTAIITGAANGIGLAIAKHFAQNGANVMMADIDEEKLENETNLLSKEFPQTKSFTGDLRQRLCLANLLSATIDEFERVDMLINASRQIMPSNSLDPKEDCFEALFKQNVLSNLRLSQIVAKRMIQQTEESDEVNETTGTIVNLSSIASERTHPDLLAYSVSCAALNQMTRSLAVSFAKEGIRVNAIAIGSVHSASLTEVLSENPELQDSMEKATPMGRIAEAKEVAEVAQFLSSDSSGFITGQIITVDGGRTLIDPLDTPIH
ncbi:MAG: SDR family oxidoreductase [Amylibacter sp.]|jgi:7-alpha-hydroxysteroid dehydrogenase|tara:strand:+ start:42022 stop:42831 length:810 start_codon:yes stop_codon:yes gene_type:complete